MQAVVYDGAGSVRVDEVPLPQVVDPGDAVVQVSLTAICGSDLHLLDGKTAGMRPGGIIGHEFVGTVHASGDDVVAVSDGDRVLGSFLIACGTCPSCRAGRYNHCRDRRALGLGRLTGDLDGAQAGYVRVPNANLNLKALAGTYERMNDEQVLFAGDVLATGFYGAAMAEAGPGMTAAVFGAGPVGLLTALAIKHRGARALVLDRDPKRVEFAGRVLPGDALLAQDEPDRAVREATGGALADVAVDAVGMTGAFKSALRCVTDGGAVVVVGVYGSERYDLPMGVVWVRGLDLRFGGMANVQAHWDEALEAVADGALDPTVLITDRLPLSAAQEGYERFRARAAMKVVMTP